MPNIVFTYFLVPFLNWSPLLMGLIIIFLSAGKYFNQVRGFSYKFLIWSVLAFKVLYASLETAGQYYVWSGSEFTKLFLDQNAINFNILKEFSGNFFWLFNNKFGYLLFYSWGRFWMEIAVSLVAAQAFYLFLRFLKKRKERFFEKEETELGFLLALMVGWSNFIIFLPLVFLSVVLVSIFKKLVFKEAYTTLGAPFLLAALIVLLFGGYIVDILGLTALRV